MLWGILGQTVLDVDIQQLRSKFPEKAKKNRILAIIQQAVFVEELPDIFVPIADERGEWNDSPSISGLR
jgi:hypothetical protein